MTPFDQLKHDYFHRVAVAPSEPRPQVVGLSDIVFHLPVLEYFAGQCQSVAEFGVREGHSTVALLSGCPGEVYSYDVEETPVVALLRAMELPCRWKFTQLDTADPLKRIRPVEMLFIDTLHTHEHVSKELAIHGRQASRYLAFHDTFTCGEFDRSGPDPRARGILPAIEEFLARYSHEYRTVYRTNWNNGLWVLERFHS